MRRLTAPRSRPSPREVLFDSPTLLIGRTRFVFLKGHLARRSRHAPPPRVPARITQLPRVLGAQGLRTEEGPKLSARRRLFCAPNPGFPQTRPISRSSPCKQAVPAARSSCRGPEGARGGGARPSEGLGTVGARGRGTWDTGTVAFGPGVSNPGRVNTEPVPTCPRRAPPGGQMSSRDSVQSLGFGGTSSISWGTRPFLPKKIPSQRQANAGNTTDRLICSHRTRHRKLQKPTVSVPLTDHPFQLPKHMPPPPPL